MQIHMPGHIVYTVHMDGRCGNGFQFQTKTITIPWHFVVFFFFYFLLLLVCSCLLASLSKENINKQLIGFDYAMRFRLTVMLFFCDCLSGPHLSSIEIDALISTNMELKASLACCLNFKSTWSNKFIDFVCESVFERDCVLLLSFFCEYFQKKIVARGLEDDEIDSKIERNTVSPALSLRHGLYFCSVSSTLSVTFVVLFFPDFFNFIIKPMQSKQTNKKKEEKKFKWNNNIEETLKEKKGRFHFECLVVVLLLTFVFGIKNISLKYSQPKAFGTYSDFFGLFFFLFFEWKWRNLFYSNSPPFV